MASMRTSARASWASNQRGWSSGICSQRVEAAEPSSSRWRARPSSQRASFASVDSGKPLDQAGQGRFVGTLLGGPGAGSRPAPLRQGRQQGRFRSQRAGGFIVGDLIEKVLRLDSMIRPEQDSGGLESVVRGILAHALGLGRFGGPEVEAAGFLRSTGSETALGQQVEVGGWAGRGKVPRLRRRVSAGPQWPGLPLATGVPGRAGTRRPRPIFGRRPSPGRPRPTSV